LQVRPGDGESPVESLKPAAKEVRAVKRSGLDPILGHGKPGRYLDQPVRITHAQAGDNRGKGWPKPNVFADRSRLELAANDMPTGSSATARSGDRAVRFVLHFFLRGKRASAPRGSLTGFRHRAGVRVAHSLPERAYKTTAPGAGLWLRRRSRGWRSIRWRGPEQRAPARPAQVNTGTVGEGRSGRLPRRDLERFQGSPVVIPAHTGRRRPCLFLLHETGRGTDDAPWAATASTAPGSGPLRADTVSSRRRNLWARMEGGRR